MPLGHCLWIYTFGFLALCWAVVFNSGVTLSGTRVVLLVAGWVLESGLVVVGARLLALGGGIGTFRWLNGILARFNS